MIALAQSESLASLAHLDLEQEILRLKRTMNAVILAHYYQDSEIQDLADFVGDSLQLSQQAAVTSADVIVSDIICTSSNAEKIVRQIPLDQPILFAPDQHLGRYLMKKTGRELRLWQGSCVVHEMFSERSLVQLKDRHPQAVILAHPECTEAVLRRADYVGSTTGILNYAKQSPATEFIVATESGILHQMEKACPDKTFISAPGEGGCACSECPHMKLNTMEKLYLCMRDRKPEITLDEELRRRALRPIVRMLEMS